jgi:2-dehydro-3-deoxyglucarate aldolase/4-hydroxy-2-oxoheptanedioate aldolase
MAKMLKEKLAAGQLVRVFCVGQLCHPKVIEIVGWHGGYDAVWLDNEHAGLSIEQIENASRAGRGTGLDSFVRLAATDYASVMRCLEAGAGGIMAAQVRSAAQVRDIVQWTKFHPQGLRGINGTGVDGRYGTTPFREYVQRSNAETFVAIQIEHADAVEEVEKIAAVPHIDLLFVGPADLSQSLGIPGDWENPKVWSAVERVARAAKAHGIHWAILPRDVEHARRCVALGCRMLSVGIDVWALQRGLTVFQKEFSELHPH